MDFAIGYYRAAILAGIRTAFPNTRPRHGPFDDPRARRDPRDPRRREKGKGGGRETVEWAGGGEGSHLARSRTRAGRFSCATEEEWRVQESDKCSSVLNP